MNVHSNLMRGHMLIGGELVQSEGGEWLESVNPANEETLGHVPAQGVEGDFRSQFCIASSRVSVLSSRLNGACVAFGYGCGLFAAPDA